MDTSGGPGHEHERDYDGTGTGHAPYGDAAYRGRGQAGDEVAQALEADLAEQFGADDPAEEHLSTRMAREGERGDGVPRLTEQDGGTNSVTDDVFADRTTDEIDGDRHELTAEEAAMHYVDEIDDGIPE
jgi:hypothetical protein